MNRAQLPLRFLGIKKLAIAIGITLAGWAICFFGLSELFSTAAYPALDSYLFVMGVTVSLLSAWGYIESQYLNVISCALGVLLWTLLTIRNPSNFNYIIINIYNFYRVIQISVSWTLKYYRNKKESKAEV